MGRRKIRTEEEKRASAVARQQKRRNKQKAERAAIKEAQQRGLPFDENR